MGNSEWYSAKRILSLVCLIRPLIIKSRMAQRLGAENKEVKRLRKFLTCLVTTSLLLVLSGCGSTKNIAQISTGNFAAGSVSVVQPSQNVSESRTSTDPPNSSSTTNTNESQEKSALLSSMDLNTAAFKNRGDLAFVWQGLLYVLDGKTGEVRQLTNSGKAQHPAWSHDGEWIAFISTNSPTGNSGQNWLVRRDGEQAHQVQGQSFSWSPTSDVLAASGTDGLWLVPVDGTPQLEVKGSVSSPYWSPDGKSIAYSVMLPYDKNKPESRSEALYTLTLSTGQAVKETTAPGAGIEIAAWWPNGKGLLYWVDPLHSASLAADGLGLMSLRFGDAQAKLLTTGLAYRDWLSVSPQGQLLMVSGGGRMVWAQKSLTIADRRDSPDTWRQSCANRHGLFC